MTRIGWFHCLAGASGDMILGSLVDAGVPLEILQAAVDTLAVERITLRASDVTRHGLGATKVDVLVPESRVARTWGNVRDLLESAELAEPVRHTALAVFERLAGAEARIHRTTPDRVHFHEVGALDALADVVGAAVGLHALGLEVIAASSVATGLGMTRGEHGLLPVPAPAVLELLKGAPVHTGGFPYEMCTPTGAAVLAAAVTRWGELPPMVVESVGCGAGGRDLAEVPNILRLVVGEAVATGATGATGAPGGDAVPAQQAVMLEANVDDLDPRLWPGVLNALMTAGASDAWLTPIQMKKGRPAVTVSVLCEPGLTAPLRGVLFRETSTIGVREQLVSKHALDRELVTVRLDGGVAVAVKVARLDGVVVNAVPEFEDVVAAAERLGRPVKAVLAEAAAAASRLAQR